MEGWIKIHRKILEWEWYDDNNVFRLFFHLLMTANYEEKSWHGITIGRGQIVTSVDNLSKQIGLSAQQIRTALCKLKSTQEITIKTTNKFTLITICNYEKYQFTDNTEQQTKQQTNNNKITNEQQTNNNNIRNKEYKKERSVNIYAQAVEELQPEIKESVMQCADEIEKWVDYKKNEFHKAYKTAATFKTFLNKLYTLGNGNPETMKAIIEQSIANQYQGIFELKKTYQNGTHQYNNPNSPEYVTTERISDAADAMLEYERQLRAKYANQ